MSNNNIYYVFIQNLNHGKNAMKSETAPVGRQIKTQINKGNGSVIKVRVIR